MTVTYAPPLTGGRRPDYGDSLTHEAIREGLPYVRGPRSTRWHRVRSGYRVLREYDSEIHEVFHYWCGQAGFGPRELLFAAAPGPGEPSCGTCEGRAIGADRERPEWLFTPWDLETPEVCPASGTQMCAPIPGNHRVATCLACGALTPIRGRGGPWNPTWGLTSHQPGPDLPEGCEFHAWRHLEHHEGVTACRCRFIQRPARSA